MRLFFIGWSGKDLGLTEVVRKLKKRHEIAYWSGDGDELESLKAEFPATIFHDHFDALHGLPPSGVAAEAFPPPEPELLDKLSGTESIVLTMMNKRFENALVSERKHLYYAQVRYWRGILKRLHPDAIIFPCAPHTVYDYVLYGLAKLFSIPCIMFELTVVGARSIVIRDFSLGSSALKYELEALPEKEVHADELPADIRSYYEWQTSADAVHTPLYMKQQFSKYAGLRKIPVKLQSVWATLIVHKDFRALLKVLTHIPRRFMRNMKTEYRSVETIPDFSKAFVYVPLSFQPERTTCPQGGVFVDQLLMLEMLSASIPDDLLIYVKEHPAQWLHRGPDFFSYRYRGYYEAIAALKNVRLIPLKTDTYMLIKHALAVATITGTAGFESIFRGKPVLLFGYPWYLFAPGLLSVWSVPTVKSALQKILDGFAPSKEDLIRYLFCLGKASFVGYCEPHGRDIQYLSPDENAEVLANVIETELQDAEL